MARCFVLEDFSVEKTKAGCSVTLYSWDERATRAFADLVKTAYGECSFRRSRSPQREGILSLGEALTINGLSPRGGAGAVREFLELVTKCLTIEDSLDESHALGYHQETDDATGRLAKTTLGKLVNRAKYDTLRKPREVIGNAVADFVTRHPRYGRATSVACVPPHKPGRTSSLPNRLVRQVSETLGLNRVTIQRVHDTAEQKEIRDEDRQAGVRKRISNQRRTMSVDTNLEGESVIVIDDLYGSGGSMQEAARALRDAGAGEVMGLAITKQRLFEGVSLAPGS